MSLAVDSRSSVGRLPSSPSSSASSSSHLRLPSPMSPSVAVPSAVSASASPVHPHPLSTLSPLRSTAVISPSPVLRRYPQHRLHPAHHASGAALHQLHPVQSTASAALPPPHPIPAGLVRMRLAALLSASTSASPSRGRLSQASPAALPSPSPSVSDIIRAWNERGGGGPALQLQHTPSSARSALSSSPRPAVDGGPLLSSLHGKVRTLTESFSRLQAQQQRMMRPWSARQQPGQAAAAPFPHPSPHSRAPSQPQGQEAVRGDVAGAASPFVSAPHVLLTVPRSRISMRRRRSSDTSAVLAHRTRAATNVGGRVAWTANSSSSSIISAGLRSCLRPSADAHSDAAHRVAAGRGMRGMKGEVEPSSLWWSSVVVDGRRHASPSDGARVRFRRSAVLREYLRAQGGSGGVPRAGGSSLGLDWIIARQSSAPVRGSAMDREAKAAAAQVQAEAATAGTARRASTPAGEDEEKEGRVEGGSRAAPPRRYPSANPAEELPRLQEAQRQRLLTLSSHRDIVDATHHSDYHQHTATHSPHSLSASVSVCHCVGVRRWRLRRRSWMRCACPGQRTLTSAADAPHPFPPLQPAERRARLISVSLACPPPLLAVLWCGVVWCNVVW